jgi:hypothetical protein
MGDVQRKCDKKIRTLGVLLTRCYAASVHSYTGRYVLQYVVIPSYLYYLHTFELELRRLQIKIKQSHLMLLI